MLINYIFLYTKIFFGRISYYEGTQEYQNLSLDHLKAEHKYQNKNHLDLPYIYIYKSPRNFCILADIDLVVQNRIILS